MLPYSHSSYQFITNCRGLVESPISIASPRHLCSLSVQFSFHWDRRHRRRFSHLSHNTRLQRLRGCRVLQKTQLGSSGSSEGFERRRANSCQFPCTFCPKRCKPWRWENVERVKKLRIALNYLSRMYPKRMGLGIIANRWTIVDPRPIATDLSLLAMHRIETKKLLVLPVAPMNFREHRMARKM